MSAYYCQSRAEREAERDSGALGRMGVSGHLRRIVLPASKKKKKTKQSKKNPGQLPFLLVDGAPCWKQSAMPTTRSTGTCTRGQIAFQARHHWGAWTIHLGKRSGTSFLPLLCSPCPPLLEAVIDGDPNIKVDLGLSDIVLGKQSAQASSVLLQHVCVILPSPALCEYLPQIPTLVPPHHYQPPR